MRMNLKKQIYQKIAKTYCRLQSSKVSGIGVFAIKDIPKNTNIFSGVKDERWANFNLADFKPLGKEIVTMVEDFFVVKPNGQVEIPTCGFNGMNVSFFLNHSNKSNVKTIDGGENFVTVRKVKKGEELTADYYTYKWFK